MFSRSKFPFGSYLEQLNNDLCRAAAVGDVKMVETILSCGASPNVHYGSFNLTPLFDAVQNNSTVSTQLLLERGAEIEARDENNCTPLHYAAGKKHHRICTTITRTWCRNRSKE